MLRRFSCASVCDDLLARQRVGRPGLSALRAALASRVRLYDAVTAIQVGEAEDVNGYTRAVGMRAHEEC